MLQAVAVPSPPSASLVRSASTNINAELARCKQADFLLYCRSAHSKRSSSVGTFGTSLPSPVQMHSVHAGPCYPPWANPCCSLLTLILGRNGSPCDTSTVETLKSGFVEQDYASCTIGCERHCVHGRSGSYHDTDDRDGINRGKSISGKIRHHDDGLNGFCCSVGQVGSHCDDELRRCCTSCDVTCEVGSSNGNQGEARILCCCYGESSRHCCSEHCQWLRELQDFAAALGPTIRQDDAKVFLPFLQQHPTCSSTDHCPARLLFFCCIR
jgi:hypothetical protein